MAETPNIGKLADHLFRHEAGKMVAVLTKIFGTENLETAEDVVQDTLLKAFEIWKLKGIPDNPAAWLHRVAKNRAIDLIRRNKHNTQYDFSDSERILLTSEYTLGTVMDSFWKEDVLQDDLLQMMFACCHPGISNENQITLILKTLCGFSTAEIAKAFLCSEDTVSKRLYRTKEFFRQEKVRLEIPNAQELKGRTSGVLNAIYLLFNEGYNSTHDTSLIRQDLVDEALVLGKLLTESSHTQMPEAFALMGLMCFHAARMQSRLSPEGAIILLPDQDRSKWDARIIALGNEYMNRAAYGDEVSSYHIEAAIAFEHCCAPDFASTNWSRILDLYNWLCRINASPVTAMNRAVAILQVEGPEAAMKALLAVGENKQMEGFYLYHSFLGELYLRLKRPAQAIDSFERAMLLTQSSTEKRLLRDKVASLMN